MQNRDGLHEEKNAVKGAGSQLRSVASSLLRVVPWAPSRLRQRLVRTGEKPYQFSHDWFGHKIPHWHALLEGFKGRAQLRYLEIGPFEGRSLLWMLDNVLTEDSAVAVAVDVFPFDFRQRLEHNLAIGGTAGKVQVIEGRGELVMRGLESESFDIIYIDGGHAAWTVFQQAGLAWQLLKNDGLLIFDDYRWRREQLPADLRPEIAIDAFVACFGQQLEVLHSGADVFVRKRDRQCRDYYCSPVTERHVYLWDERKLLRTDDQREIALTDAQRSTLEKLLLGSPSFAFEEILLDPAFRDVVNRLQNDAP
jgi:predicted O-methyltransferase YrrM